MDLTPPRLDAVCADRAPVPTIALARGGALRVVSYVFVVFTLWSLIGRYWGIQHDALGYVVDAMARLHGQPLAGDLFLRYRSQDEFTIFPGLLAACIARFGVDHAAALLTFVALASWTVLSWFLASRLVGRDLARLSVGLILVLPGWYSASEVFRYAEPFVTARGLAEVSSLAAVLAVLRGHRLAAIGLAALGLLLHPLMALPGLLMATALALPLSGWKQWSAAWLLVVAGACAGSFVLIRPDAFMDGPWLAVTRQRSGFLFVDVWHSRDWEVAVQAIATLAIAVVAIPASEARRVAATALWVGTAGLALATIASTLLPLTLLVQGQPWRWLWIGRYFATALLPFVAVTSWRHGAAGRAAALLLASAWLLTDSGSTRDLPPFGAGGLLCMASLAVLAMRRHLSPSTAAVIEKLSWVVIALVGVVFVSVVTVAVHNNFSFGRDPVWIQRVTDVLYTPGFTAAIVIAAWFAAFRLAKGWFAAAFTVAALGIATASAKETVAVWTKENFGDEQRAQFAPWRARIPRDSEVLWDDAPQAAWLLLDRRSFLSVSQAAGTTFSADTTREIVRRANALSALVSPGTWWLDPATRGDRFRDLTPGILRSICQEPSLGYVVSRIDIGSWVNRAEWPGKADFLYLYDCGPLRQAGKP